MELAAFGLEVTGVLVETDVVVPVAVLGVVVLVVAVVSAFNNHKTILPGNHTALRQFIQYANKLLKQAA